MLFYILGRVNIHMYRKVISTNLITNMATTKVNEKIRCNIPQSIGLSKRLTQMNEEGRKLNDDSSFSESTLSDAMIEVLLYAKERVTKIGGTISHRKKISLYECQEYFNKVGGPIPNERNKKVCMKPDGGIIFARINSIEYPILIVEDKVQGTNDTLFQENKKRQATGNAIERGGKNIRGAEMIFSWMDIFPYVLFASGCDFHHTESISQRIVMMNMGVPNHYIEINPEKTPEMIDSNIDDIIRSITINKLCGKSITSVFVKAHKWNEMKHGCSMWKKNEIVKICCKVIDLVIEELVKKTLVKQDT